MKPPLSPSRRTFLRGTAAAATAVTLGASAGRAAIARAPAEGDDPARPKKVIDCHAHLHHHSNPRWEADDRKLIEDSARLGIDQLCCSILTPTRPASAEGFRECNRWMADAMKRHPGVVLGYCYVNPSHTKEAVDEVRRCVEERGFIGVKLYNEHRCTDPEVAPIIELVSELRVPVLHHAGHPHHPLPGQPNISDGGDLAELSRRFPEAMLICAHVCGGGDWEWTIKALRHAPSVSLDLSGSVADDGVIDMAMAVLGADRLLFGCDMSLTASVGRLRGADLAPGDRRKIFGENMERLLGRRDG